MLDDLKGYLYGIIECADLILSDSSGTLNADQRGWVQQIGINAAKEIPALAIFEMVLAQNREDAYQLGFEVRTYIGGIKYCSDLLLLLHPETLTEAQLQRIRQIDTLIEIVSKQVYAAMRATWRKE